MNGYFVVLGDEAVPGSPNTRYQGIDRMPPFDLDRWEAGIDWPTLPPSGLVDDNFMTANREQALLVAELFQKIFPERRIEIIYVDNAPAVNAEVSNDYPFLGFDVAGDAPYYSVLGNFPQKRELRPFLERLNSYGLFDSHVDAEEYLTVCRQIGWAEPRQRPFLWSIWQATPGA